jgi:hypothetical protein
MPDDDDEDVGDLEADEIYTDGVDSLDAAADRHSGRERDGVESLQDTEAEQGDEQEVDDDFDLDRRAAREAGVNLDSIDQEPRLD